MESLDEQKSAGVQIHFQTSWIWAWLVFLALVVELRGVQSVELSSSTLWMLFLCLEGFGDASGSSGNDSVCDNQPPSMRFVPVLVELPCLCQALEYDWIS